MKQKKARRNRRLFAIMAVVALCAAGYAVTRAPSINIHSVDHLKPVQSSDRILIFAPHCDDEVLSSGGLIQKAVDKGAQVKVVLITNGDNNLFSTDIEFKTLYPTAKKFIEAGELRQQESLHALKSLGIRESDVIFLGYPDRGIRTLYRRNWDDSKPLRSSATHKTNSVYKLTYDKGAVYSGSSLLKNIKSIMRDFRPTIVVAPHSSDHHPDHRYSFNFIMLALNQSYASEIERQSRPRLLTYIVHNPRFPHPRGMRPDEYITPPFTASFDMNWYRLMLTRHEEENKRLAIKQYKSQLKVPELGGLMRSFIRKNELFEIVEY